MSKDMTGSGHKIDFKNPGDYTFEIAHLSRGMAFTARFSGHTNWYFSVAQHCAIMSTLVPIEHAAEALLWGAAKAFCGDLTPGMKDMLPGYKDIVRRVDAAIRAQFGLPTNPSGSVEIANQMVLDAARRTLMPNDLDYQSQYGITRYTKTIHAANAVRAQGIWLERWVALQGMLRGAATPSNGLVG